jgi:glyoxylase-like metal-dependent hydrolase (beta-lactamase superfamily II)
MVVERSGSLPADAAHGIRIETGSFGPWQTNAYLVWDGRSPHALVVDPGMGAAAPLAARVVEAGLDLHLIADSHGHIDHVFDNAELHEATGAPIAIHPDDAYRLVGSLYNVARSSWPVRGMSGDLSLDADGRVHRALPLAQFRNGRPAAYEVPVAGAPSRELVGTR